MCEKRGLILLYLHLMQMGMGKECYFLKTLSLSRLSSVRGWYSKSAFISIVLWTDMVRCLYLDARIRQSYADNAIIVIPRRRHSFRALCIIGRKLAVDDVCPPFFPLRVNQIFDRQHLSVSKHARDVLIKKTFAFL